MHYDEQIWIPAALSSSFNCILSSFKWLAVNCVFAANISQVHLKALWNVRKVKCHKIPGGGNEKGTRKGQDVLVTICTCGGDGTNCKSHLKQKMSPLPSISLSACLTACVCFWCNLGHICSIDWDVMSHALAVLFSFVTFSQFYCTPLAPSVFSLSGLEQLKLFFFFCFFFHYNTSILYGKIKIK